MTAPTSEDFEKWLSQKIKHNGDKLLPTTIERYVSMTEEFFKLGDRIHDQEAVLSLAQKIIGSNSVLYFAIKNMMEFLGYPESIKSQFKAPRARAKAMTSRRFLQTRIISRKELSRLYEEIKDPTLNLCVRVLYDTACRRAELLGMQWKDIYWKSEKHKVDQEFVQQGIYAEIRIRGKGNKVRMVYLGKETARIIKLAHLKDPWSREDYLIRFISRNTGLPVKDQANKLYKMLVKEVDRILGRHISPHAMRHTRLTHMADMGADILDIAALAGHEDISTTKIYVEISSFRARQAFALYSGDSFRSRSSSPGSLTSQDALGGTTRAN